jgi:hypothetical protein
MDSQRPPAPDGGDITDRREEFERLSRETPRNPEAERAFIEAKIDLVRSDPKLTEEEKLRAIADLRQRLTPP